MKNFGESLFDFVAEVLDKHPMYRLTGLNVSSFDGGFDYAIDAENLKGAEDLQTVLKKDLAGVEIDSPETPIAINLVLTSESGAHLSCRFLETWVQSEEDEEEEEDAPCCKQSCCNRKSSESAGDEAEMFHRILVDFRKFLHDQVADCNRVKPSQATERFCRDRRMRSRFDNCDEFPFF